MRKFIAVLCVALTLVAICVSAATADQKTTNSCGDNGGGNGLSSLGLSYQGSSNHVWDVTFTSWCPSGKTFEYEIQHKVSGSFSDVHEANGGDIDHTITQPLDGQVAWEKLPQATNACVPGDIYRLVGYYNDNGLQASQKFPSVNGGVFC